MPSSSRNSDPPSGSGSDWIKEVLGPDGLGSSATRQMVIGGVSGWVTGYLAMKVGKVVAVALGGGIILLQVANHQGYINVNWSRFQSDVDKMASKVVDGDKKKNWTDKLERKLENLAGKAEDLANRTENRTRRWYDKMLGRESRDLQLFLTSFAVGTALGVVIGG